MGHGCRETVRAARARLPVAARDDPRAARADCAARSRQARASPSHARRARRRPQAADAMDCRSSISRDWLKFGLASASIVDGLTGLGQPRPRECAPPPSGARIHVLGYHRVVDADRLRRPVNPSLCITTDALPPPDGAAARALRRAAARRRRARRRRPALPASATPWPHLRRRLPRRATARRCRSCASSACRRRCSCRPASPCRAATALPHDRLYAAFACAPRKESACGSPARLPPHDWRC